MKANYSCKYAASCFECPLPECKVTAREAVYTNCIGLDLSKEEWENVVVAVRCKDCQYCKTFERPYDRENYFICTKHYMDCQPAHYCSFGKRRKDT